MFKSAAELAPVIQFLIDLYGHNRDLTEIIKESNFSFTCKDNLKSITVSVNWTHAGLGYGNDFTLLHSDKAYKVEAYLNDLMDEAFKLIEQVVEH